MIGRDDAVEKIAAELSLHRFVTIVGPGGIGKTSVALAVAHGQLASFDGQVCFVDFGALTETAARSRHDCLGAWTDRQLRRPDARAC